jgi:hypothetical protein
MRWYVNCFKKLRCFDRVDLVFDGDENGTIAGLGFREHCGSWQVIPYSRVVLGSGNEKGERKSRHAAIPTAETRRVFSKPARSAKAPQRTLPIAMLP